MMTINKNRNKVSGAWDINFHKIVEQARQQYSKQIGKEITMSDVTRIWGKSDMTKFKIPKLRRRTWL